MSSSFQSRLGTAPEEAIKAPCRVATTAAISLSGEQTIDGVSVEAGDRVFVKDQAIGAQDGIYVVQTGSWTRAPDWDGPGDVVSGMLVPITSGTVSATLVYMVTFSGSFTVGSSSFTATVVISKSNAADVPYDQDTGQTTVEVGLDARVPFVETLVALQALDISNVTDQTRRDTFGRAAANDGGAAEFRFRTGDQSANVTAKPERFFPPDSEATGSDGAWELIRFKDSFVPTLADLTALPSTAPFDDQRLDILGRASAYDAGAATFRWHSDDQSANVTASPTRFFPPDDDATGASGAWELVLFKKNRVDSMFDLVSIPTAALFHGQTIEGRAFYSDTDTGGGHFYWDGDKAKSDADGVTAIDPDNVGTLSSTALGTFLSQQGTAASGTGCWVRLDTAFTINSMADLFELPLPVVYLTRFYTDEAGFDKPLVLRWQSGVSQTNHNGGTIVDVLHSTTPGNSGWWVSENSNNGVYVADVGGQRNVLWFGAKGDEALDGTGYDSWDAVDATYRSCYWDHKANTSTTRPWVRITFPNVSPDGQGGYHLSKQFNSASTGWPLQSAGVSWTLAQAREAKIEVLGDYAADPFGRTRITKAGADYAFRLPVSHFMFRNLRITGQGNSDPLTNTTESHPAILANNSCHGENIFIGNCGGPDYASREGSHVTVDKGRVGYRIADGNSVPSSFAIGLIVDDSANGADGGGSDVNTCRWKNLNFQSVHGDCVFLSVADNQSSNANASLFEIADMDNITGSVVAINGGWRNRVICQEAINAEAALKLSVYSPPENLQCFGNRGEVIYGGDGLQRLLYLDDRTGVGTNHDNTLRNNIVINQDTGVTTSEALGVVSSANSVTLDRNGIEVWSRAEINTPTKVGFGALLHQYSLQDSFDGTAGNLSVSIINDLISNTSLVSNDFLNNCTYHLYCKLNSGNGDLDAHAHFMVSFVNGGNAEGGDMVNVSGSSSRTISLDLSTPSDPKIVFSSGAASNRAGVIAQHAASYFWGT